MYFFLNFEFVSLFCAFRFERAQRQLRLPGRTRPALFIIIITGQPLVPGVAQARHRERPRRRQSVGVRRALRTRPVDAAGLEAQGVAGSADARRQAIVAVSARALRKAREALPSRVRARLRALGARVARAVLEVIGGAGPDAARLDNGLEARGLEGRGTTSPCLSLRPRCRTRSTS